MEVRSKRFIKNISRCFVECKITRNHKRDALPSSEPNIINQRLSKEREREDLIHTGNTDITCDLKNINILLNTDNKCNLKKTVPQMLNEAFSNTTIKYQSSG